MADGDRRMLDVKWRIWGVGFRISDFGFRISDFGCVDRIDKTLDRTTTGIVKV
jgi:hypothetical protein